MLITFRKKVFWAVGSTKNLLIRLRVIVLSLHTSVDGLEGKTNKTVVVRVIHELGADGGCSLNSLAGGCHATNDNRVRVNIA